MQDANSIRRLIKYITDVKLLSPNPKTQSEVSFLNGWKEALFWVLDEDYSQFVDKTRDMPNFIVDWSKENAD